MARQSRRASEVFFSYKEATAGTADGNCFFEGLGNAFPLPEPTYMLESDYGKMGSGEHGTLSEIQAVYTPWSYSPQRLSEIAYFMSFFMGADDYFPGFAASPGAGAYLHDMHHLPVTTRTMPTFSYEYDEVGSDSNVISSGNVVNEFSITLAEGGNGVVDASFSGFGNRHYISDGAIVGNTTGSMTSGENSFSSEPLVNFKSCDFWKGDALESGFGLTSLSLQGEDLGANLVTLTPILKSITITGNNGMSPENQLRANGGGVINFWERGDRRFTIECTLMKDDVLIESDTLLLANSQFALELGFRGPNIGASNYPYAMNLFLPVVQATQAPQDDETPVGKTWGFEVFEDSNNNSMIAYFQTGVSVGYNATK